MRVFDETIRKTSALLSESEPRVYKFIPGGSAREGKKNELIMDRDSAFELGAAALGSVNYSLFTNERELVPRDEILLYGRELYELKNDSDFARITVILTDDIEENGEQGAYAIIKDIEMKKFEVSPEGYMMRVSALSNREQVRVSKAAVKSKLSFEQVGNLFIEKYKQNSHVLAVKVIFITLPDAPYEEMDVLATTAVNITKALNHIIADMNMDCSHCGWKPVCDEVEGLKEMHFKASRNSEKNNMEE
jgi:hypothetical protein